jgi:YVTN family beta-propeller protein
MIKRYLLFACFFAGCLLQLSAQKGKAYAIVNTFHIKSPGYWDYLAINGNNLYVSHGTQVNILEKNTGDSLGIIPGTTGIHGIAFDGPDKKGFTSNGKLNNVFVFNLATFKVTGQIATGENPDAILYDPFSKKIITCNGRSKNLSVIDPVTEKVVATIPVGGKPETLVSDEAGKWFVNIEDKNEIVVVDAAAYVVLHHWALAPGEEPSGLAIDKTGKRLFAGCGNQQLIVVDGVTGKEIKTLPIGDGCDGVAYDAEKKTIYSSNGDDGTLTVIAQLSKDNYKVTENVPTKKGAKTLVVDAQTHKVYSSRGELKPQAKGEAGRPAMIPGTFEVLVIAN